MAEKKKYTILILEDDRQLAAAAREGLMKHGFEVIVFETVEDGIRQLKTGKRIDVIWLDHYLLGSGNGVDFVVAVKKHPEWKNIPIFVISNTASAPNIHAYLELGISNFYTKSDHDIKEIINDIETSLERETKI